LCLPPFLRCFFPLSFSGAGGPKPSSCSPSSHFHLVSFFTFFSFLLIGSRTTFCGFYPPRRVLSGDAWDTPLSSFRPPLFPQRAPRFFYAIFVQTCRLVSDVCPPLHPSLSSLIRHRPPPPAFCQRRSFFFFAFFFFFSSKCFDCFGTTFFYLLWILLFLSYCCRTLGGGLPS